MSPEAAFDIVVDHSSDTLRVTASGELDLNAEEELLDALRQGLGPSTRRVVLDLGAVSFMDSSGIRALLVSRELSKEHGCPMLLMVEDGPVTRLLRLAGVQDWFSYA